MPLKAGDVLWFVPISKTGPSYDTTVIKVGRKWAELSNRCRISVDTLVADGGRYISPGRAYRSRTEYEAECARYKAWTELRDAVAHKPRVPSHLSTDQIKEIHALIKGVPVAPSLPQQKAPA